MREFSLPALYEVPSDGNLTDIVRRNAAQHPEVAVIARKVNGAWQDVSATAFLAEVHAAAKGLIAAGVQPGDRVGLMSRTRYEWTLLDFAIWSAGAVTVPVYETSSPEQVQWILSDSGATACIVELDGHAAAVESVRESLPALKHVWQIEAGGVAELERLGQDVSDETVQERGSLAKADDPATIVYTSGTTGRPKGCVLTHRSFFAECGNVVERLRPLFRTGECSVLLFLPLAHVFGRLVQVAPMMAPIKLGCVPDIKNLTDELAAFRPTLILGVPRVFEKVYNSARAKAQADGKGKIFDKAADTAIAYSKALDTPSGPSFGLRIKHKVFDKLVYGKLRAVLGGRGEYAISGGAPLGERLGHFFRGIGFTVLEGYGLTESCAATAFNPWDRPEDRHGRPAAGSRRRAMLCRNAWMPPGRGGKSFVTMRVLRIVADPTQRRLTGRYGRAFGLRTGGRGIMAPTAPGTAIGRKQGLDVDRTDGRRQVPWLLAVWALTRLFLLLFVFKVYVFPGPDVTSDISVIYQGWYEVLRTGTFPLDDVTWQYPPAAALAVLSPRCCSSSTTRTPSSSWPSSPTSSRSPSCCTPPGAPAGPRAAPGCGSPGCRCSGRPSTPATT
ncbi:2-succinylbenzoate--CoA ligase [Streptomyces glaucescens]